MKKTLLLMFAIVASVGMAWADKTVFLDPASFDSSNNWTASGAKFAVYAWTKENVGTWYSMTAVEGTAYYEAKVADANVKCHVLRINSEVNGTSDLDWSKVWNRAININLNGNVLVKITGWNGGETYENNGAYPESSSYTAYSATESLNTYTVNLVTNTWTTPEAYAFGNNDFAVFGAWPGTKMKEADTETINGTSYKKWTVSATQPVAPTGLVFNENGGNVEGSTQTINLPFVNSKTYYWGVTGATASTDTNVAADAIAFIGTNNVSDILNGTGAQPNSYDSEGKMNIVVDLGPTQTIDGFSITFSGDRWVSEFDLSYSTDGVTYTKIGTYTTGISENTTTTVTGSFEAPVTAKYIKYTSKQSNKNVTSDTYSERIHSFQLIQYASDALAISSLTATPSEVVKGVATDITFTAKNAQGKDLSSYGDRVTVSYAITEGEGTLEDNKLTVNGSSVTITATAKDVKNNTTTTATTPITAVVAPTAKADVKYPETDILKVYTADYTNGEHGSGWGKGSHTATWTGDPSTYSVGGSTVLHVKGNGYSSRTENTTNATDYTTAYVAVFPITGGTLYVFDDGENSENPFTTVTAGEWNYVKLPVNFSTNYIGFSIDGETELYVDYIVLSKETTEAQFAIGTEDANGFVAVSGTIKTENVSDVEAITAKVIDLRNATLGTGVTGFTLHTNQLIIAKAESASNESKESAMAEALTANDNNVIITNGTWYWAMKPIVYTDDNEHQPVSFSINTLDQGYTITRSIPAGKYVTAAPMATINNVNEGISIYEFTGYENGAVTFTKKSEQPLNAKTPYILYNTTSAAIDLAATGTGDLDPTVGAQTVTKEGANFVANLKELTTDGTQYIVSNGNIMKGKGVTVGAYRAYFTGVTAATGTARAIFFDGEATSIATIGANGEIEKAEVYNLRGQRVQNAQKGLYIVNGKKMILK